MNFIIIFFSYVQESEELEFPLISICPGYTFKNSEIDFLHEILSKSTRSFAKKWIQNHTRSRQDFIHFISHRHDQEMFRCNIVMNSRGTLGRPCIFPFYYKDCLLSNKFDPTQSHQCSSFDKPHNRTLHYTCTTTDENRRWCATRVYQNLSGIPEHWGFCTEDCNGEIPEWENSGNLAHELHEDKWEERLFDLDRWGNGRCFTYESNTKHEKGPNGNFYAYLANKYSTIDNYNIYLHSKEVENYFKRSVF